MATGTRDLDLAAGDPVVYSRCAPLKSADAALAQKAGSMPMDVRLQRIWERRFSRLRIPMLLVMLGGMCTAVTLAVFFMVSSAEVLEHGPTRGTLLGWFWSLTVIGGTAALTSVDAARDSPFRFSLRTALPSALWGLFVAGCIHAPMWVFQSMSFLRMISGLPPPPFFEFEVALPLSVIALIVGVVAHESLASVASSPWVGRPRET